MSTGPYETIYPKVSTPLSAGGSQEMRALRALTSAARVWGGSGTVGAGLGVVGGGGGWVVGSMGKKNSS